MNNFNELKIRLQKFDGKSMTMITMNGFGKLMGLDNCRVFDVVGRDIPAINICNINHILNDPNPISIIISEDNVADYKIVEADGNEEIWIDDIFGIKTVIMG